MRLKNKVKSCFLVKPLTVFNLKLHDSRKQRTIFDLPFHSDIMTQIFSVVAVLIHWKEEP
jgi:hypothetical protein